MGRPARQSGHLAGTFAPPNIQPNQGNGHCGLSSTQPLRNQPPQSQVSIPIRPQNWQLGSSQYGSFLAAEPYTPSTTEALSPVSSRATLSPGTTSASISYTAALGHSRHLSPDVATPNSSAAISSTYQDVYYTERSSEQPQHSTARPNDYVLAPKQAITEDVIMGIDIHETTPYIAHSPRFISTKSSSPTQHQRYPGTTEPWSIYPLRQDDAYGGLDTSPPETMDFVSDAVQNQTPREKGGGRTGPLSQAQRQHASEVRKNGACLRCSIMREKCDLQAPCTTCSSKDRRKAPKTCVPRQFDWEGFGRSIFPDELTSHLRTGNLFPSLANRSFAFSSRPDFLIPLELHIGIEMSVKVKEFDPLHSAPDIRHAYEATQDAHGNQSLEQRPVWNPPIIMNIREGDFKRQRTLIHMQITKKFEQLLDDAKAWDQWTWSYFPYDEEDFQRDILQRIGKYYRKNLGEHSILRTSLSLLWFEYLLMVNFTIPPTALPHLEANLGASKPRKPFGRVIPDTINRFLKAIILPMAEVAAKKLTDNLHDLLFKLAVTPKLSTTGRNDLALCMLLILKLFLSRTQATLLLLVASPADEIEMEYTTADAAETIYKMESVADYFVSLHKYTLSRKSCRSPSISAGIESPSEAHARKFDLKGRLIREVAKEYAHQRPTNLKFHVAELGDTFRYMNVRRQCWRVLTNVKDGS